MGFLAYPAIVLAFAAGLLLAVGTSRIMLAERGALRQRVRSLAAYPIAEQEGRPPAAVRTDKAGAAAQGGWSARTALQLERAGLQDEIEPHALALVELVAVLHGVDDRFADRHAHVMDRFLVETQHAAQVVEDRLDHVEHLDTAGDVEPDRPGVGALHRLLDWPLEGSGCGWRRTVARPVERRQDSLP